MKGIIIGLPLQENSIVLCDKVVVQDRSIMVRFSYDLLKACYSKAKTSTESDARWFSKPYSFEVFSFFVKPVLSVWH